MPPGYFINFETTFTDDSTYQLCTRHDMHILPSVDCTFLLFYLTKRQSQSLNGDESKILAL